jgi:hypothetical protein
VTIARPEAFIATDRSPWGSVLWASAAVFET